MMRMKPEQWQDVIDVNLSGVFYCTQASAVNTETAGLAWAGGGGVQEGQGSSAAGADGGNAGRRF